MFAPIIALALGASAVVAQNLVIATPPSLIQCETVELSWSGGQASYYLAVVDAGQPCGDELEDFDETTETKISWKVNVPSGVTVQLALEDGAGTVAWSGPVKVGPSSDSSCLTETSGSETSGSSAASNPTNTGISLTPNPTAGTSGGNGNGSGNGSGNGTPNNVAGIGAQENSSSAAAPTGQSSGALGAASVHWVALVGALSTAAYALF